jgi:hypothetical protein
LNYNRLQGEFNPRRVLAHHFLLGETTEVEAAEKDRNFTTTRSQDAIMYYKGEYQIVLNLHANYN